MDALQSAWELRLQALEKRALEAEAYIDRQKTIQQARAKVANSEGPMALSIVGQIRVSMENLDTYIKNTEEEARSLKAARSLLEEENG